MNKNLLISSIIAISLATPVWAFDGPPRGEPGSSDAQEIRGNYGKHGKRSQVHEKLKNMSEEERKAFKAEVKEKWDALSEQEKAEFKAKMEARKQQREERRLVRQYGMHLLMQQENTGE